MKLEHKAGIFSRRNWKTGRKSLHILRTLQELLFLNFTSGQVSENRFVDMKSCKVHLKSTRRRKEDGGRITHRTATYMLAVIEKHK